MRSLGNDTVLTHPSQYSRSVDKASLVAAAKGFVFTQLEGPNGGERRWLLDVEEARNVAPSPAKPLHLTVNAFNSARHYLAPAATYHIGIESMRKESSIRDDLYTVASEDFTYKNPLARRLPPPSYSSRTTANTISGI